MSDYTITAKYQSLSIDVVISLIKNQMSERNSISSISGVIYEITAVNEGNIVFKTKSRNRGETEIISFENIEIVLDILKGIELFNTSNPTLKMKIPNKVYKKRSPLFAILLATGVIIKT